LPQKSARSGAYEYQGQKCSAASRAYIPDTLWPLVKERRLDEIAAIQVGDVCDFCNFMGAVIDRGTFKTISEYIDFAKHDPNMEILCGGTYDDREGYFIAPKADERGDLRPGLDRVRVSERGVRADDGAVQHRRTIGTPSWPSRRIGKSPAPTRVGIESSSPGEKIDSRKGAEIAKRRSLCPD
jgi:Aldehyde dehydrogenase family